MSENVDDATPANLPTQRKDEDENDGVSSPKKLKLSTMDILSNGHVVTAEDDKIAPKDDADVEVESAVVLEVDAAEEKGEDAALEETPTSSGAPTPVVVPSSTADSDSDVEILSSDDEEIRKKRDEAEKAKTHKAKQVLNSIKKFDLKALGSKIKLNVTKPLSSVLKEEGAATKGSSDGFSPAVTSSPSCASEDEEKAEKIKEEEVEVYDGVSEWSNRRNGINGKRPWRRETSVTTEDSSRCSSPCEDPLEREPEEKEARNEEETPREEGLTVEGVREAALKNAAINEEYNVKNILSRLKAATLTLNNTDAVRGVDEDEDAGVEIVEKEKFFCEIILESSDEEEEEEDKKDGGDSNDVQVIANPNIKILEQTQVRKVAEQLSSAGVTVKNSVPKVPKQLFPKWQTITHISPMVAFASTNRTVRHPPPVPKHLQRPIKVLSLFDGISGCLVALKQMGISIDAYISSENDDFSKIVTMVRHPEAAQLGDPRLVNDKVLRDHGPFDLVLGGLPCDDFENDGALRNHKAGMHFQIFADVLKSCVRQHKKAELSTPFHWVFYNVDLSQRHRDRISSVLNCDPVKLDAIHISPMRKPDYFWSNIPDLENVLTPLPQLDRLNLQDCLEPDRVARVRRLNTFTVSFDSMRQGPYHQVPINHGGELDDLWMVEVERVLGFPDHYTDVANLPPKDRLTILAMSGSVPLFRHILTPLRRYYAHSGS